MQFLQAIQARTARVAVGPSTVRGQRVRGVAASARVHLSKLELAQFGISRASLFRRRLDAETQRLARAFPKGGGSWGLARKVLNIFLRDALYTAYLRDAYRLDAAEELLELPLDSITVKRLRATVGRGQLPRWPGVRHLSPEASDRYQAAASAVARPQRIARVHLDAFWWGIRTDSA